MRTSILIAGLVAGIVAVSLFAPTATAQVYTDPVGFVKADTVKNGLTMISVPLDAGDKKLNGVAGCVGDMIKENLLGGPGLGAADVVYKWDPAVQDYKYAFLVKAPGTPYDGKWFDPKAGQPSTLTFDSGEAMWILRRNTGTNPAIITFLGWVPMEATTSVSLIQGLTMFNWPYPTTLKLNDSTLYTVADGGPGLGAADVVYKWDSALQDYSYSFLVDAPGSPFHGKWFDPKKAALSDITFEPGIGFWFLRRPAAACVWPCTRPY